MTNQTGSIPPSDLGLNISSITSLDPLEFLDKIHNVIAYEKKLLFYFILNLAKILEFLN